MESDSQFSRMVSPCCNKKIKIVKCQQTKKQKYLRRLAITEIKLCAQIKLFRSIHTNEIDIYL